MEGLLNGKQKKGEQKGGNSCLIVDYFLKPKHVYHVFRIIHMSYAKDFLVSLVVQKAPSRVVKCY